MVRPLRMHTHVGKGFEELDRKVDVPVIWQHCRLDHNSELQDITMSVTGLYLND